MAKPGRDRNPRVERRERSSFIVLQHIHTLAQAIDHPLSARRVIADLALPVDEGYAAMNHLYAARLVDWDRIDVVELRTEGREYVELRAGRRRSVRLEDEVAAGGMHAPPAGPSAGR